jgi:hypothetical protein
MLTGAVCRAEVDIQSRFRESELDHPRLALGVQIVGGMYSSPIRLVQKQH